MEFFDPIKQKDIILFICSFLSNKDKLSFLSVCKFAHGLKQYIIYKEPIDLDKILVLDYYNQFINIRATASEIDNMKNYNKKFPDKMVKLKLFYFREHIYNLIKDSYYLTHLVFDNGCRVIDNRMPQLHKITHLTWNIQQKIKKRFLPKNLLHLEIGYNPNRDCYIPNTIKKLTLMYGNRFDISSLNNLKILEFKSTNHFNLDIFLYTFPKNMEILVLNHVLYIDFIGVLDTVINIPNNIILVLDKKYYRDFYHNCLDIKIKNLNDDVFEKFCDFIKKYNWKIVWIDFSK